MDTNLYLKTILLFDGECHLCNSAVMFILKKEKNEHGGKDKDDEPEKHNDNDELDGIRAIRLIDPRGTSGSRCTIADIDIRGWLENDS